MSNDNSAAAKESPRPPSLRGRISSVLALIVEFFRDIARTWTRILLEVLLPFSSDFIGVPALRSAKPDNVTSALLPTGLSLSRSRRSFAERLKYTVVTSFLLTATLSISMYGSETAVHEDEAAFEEERKLLGESMPVSKPAIETTRANLPSPRHTLASVVRNAIVWTVALLWYFSPSTQQWFRTSLLVVCCAWSLSLLVTSLGKADKRRSPLQFELVQPSSNCVPSAPLSSYLAEKRAHASLNEGVSNLVKTACDTDVELNRSLAALQEIELVARGFKIGQQHQHFMPPISRIEAATNGAPSRNGVGLSSQLYSPPFSGKRSVSLTSTESNVKHSFEQRRASPPPPPMHRMLQLRTALSQSFEDAERASKEFGEALEPLADPKELEQLGDMYSLDQIAGAGSSEDDYAAGLASMASKRVAGLASPPLISSSSSRFATPTSHRRAFSHLAGSPSQSTTPGAAAASGDWDDSFTSTPGSKRGSWTNATLPRSFGSTAASTGLPSSHHKRRGSNIALAPMMLTAGVSAVAKSSNDGDAAAPPLSSSSSSSASITSGKRYSNDSLGGSSQVSSSTGLGRSGSLLRNRNGEAITWDQQTPGPGEGVGASPSAPPRSGSRLSYISEGSVSSGPNGSPAAKRMSYQHQQQSVDPKHGSVLESRPGSRLSAASSSLGAITIGADGQDAKHHLASPPHSANSATSSSTSASAAGAAAAAAAASSPMHWQQQQQPQSPKRPTTAGPLSTSSPPHSSSSMTIGRAGSLRSIRRTLFTPPTTSSGTALGVASTSFEADAAHQHHIGSALPSPSAGPAAAAAAAGGGQYDPFSLLGLRQSFERFHLVRRRALCLLLALHFEGEADEVGKPEDGKTSNKRDYWDMVARAMQRLSLQLESIKVRMTKAVDEEMNHFVGKDAAASTATSPGAATGSAAHLLPGSQGLLPFTGLDDRAEALVSSLRSIQVKIRACNEELLMDWPPPAVSLHGSSTTSTAGGSGGEGQQDVWGQSVVSQRKENAERLWDSIREDLLAVTQEWEGGMKLFRAEKARAAAAATTATPAVEAARLESPLEVDEGRYGDLEDDEIDVEPTTTTSSSHADSHSRSASINSAEDLASSLLRLRAASPPPSSPRLDGGGSSSSIPGSPSIPSGLEQIFESIAGIAVSLQEEEKEKRRKRQASHSSGNGGSGAGSGGGGGQGVKLSREERIARVKSQRAELERRRTLGLPLELPRESLSGSDAGGIKPHGGVVTELKDVLSGIRVKRERQREEAEAEAQARASVASAPPSSVNAAQGGSSSTDSNLTLAATSTSCGSSSRTSATTWSSVATPATSSTATTTGSSTRGSAPTSPSTPPTPQSPQPQPPPRPPRGGVPASPPRVRKESTQGEDDGDDSDEKTLAAATAAAAAAAVRARRGRQGSGTKVGTT